MTDHDLLVTINEQVKALHECVKNHLHRHWQITLMALTAALAGIVSAVIAWWK